MEFIFGSRITILTSLSCYAIENTPSQVVVLYDQCLKLIICYSKNAWHLWLIWIQQFNLLETSCHNIINCNVILSECNNCNKILVDMNI